VESRVINLGVLMEIFLNVKVY